MLGYFYTTCHVTVLRKNNDFFFYTTLTDWCLLRGTNRIFKYNKILILIFKV